MSIKVRNRGTDTGIIKLAGRITIRVPARKTINYYDVRMEDVIEKTDNIYIWDLVKPIKPTKKEEKDLKPVDVGKTKIRRKRLKGDKR